LAERYDAAIIGAGADGLAAAARLAARGMRVVVLERASQPGGRLVTRPFHAGYRASSFADDIAPIPSALFWSLDLARHGARRAPGEIASALWPGRAVVRGGDAYREVCEEARRRRDAALAYAAVPPSRPPSRFNPFATREREIWPAQSWMLRPLAEVVARHVEDDGEAALAVAAALEGQAADPFAAGTALHLLTAPQPAAWRGALGGLGAALTAAAQAAGAEIACDREVSEIRCHKGRVAGLGLADGGEIAAAAVISTLDVKRTFLSLFPWSDLEKSIVRQIGDVRMAGATARLLVALGGKPRLAVPGALPRGAIHLSPDAPDLVEAHAAWRAGILAERLPMAVRIPSLVDPGLAPQGGAVLTVTIGCVPHTPFDGPWTHDKRDVLVKRVLAAVQQVMPGLADLVVAFELLTPPDIERALGVTAGDLSGGAIAPDQMFAWRPGFRDKSPLTPVPGLYLAGPSSAAGALGTCVAGAIAADALFADRHAGRLP